MLDRSPEPRFGREIASATSDEERDRVARVTQRVIEAFGDEALARQWMRRPNRALQGVAPVDLLGIDAGAALVSDELGRVGYGDLY